MTTSLQTDPRRAKRDVSRKSVRAPLEMPVLFQLADLSLHQEKSAHPSSPPATPIAESIAPPVPQFVDKNVVAEPPAVVEPIKKEIPKAELPSLEAPPAEVKVKNLEPEPQPVAPSTIAEETKAASTVTAASPVGVPAVEKAAEPTPAIVTVVSTNPTEVTPPKEPTAPTPRERAEQRAKNRQAIPASNDWMRTHGKYIAVGFIIALIATIYMAQNGDEPVPAKPASHVSAKSETDLVAPPSAAEAAAKAAIEADARITDAYTAKESSPISPALSKEVNPAEGLSSEEAHAELPTPPTDIAVTEPVETSEVADSKSLFPWKESTDARVASKPDDGRGKVQLNPHVTERPTKAETDASADEPAAESPSVYGPPGSQPQEPAGEQPADSNPRLNAPTNYPVTSPSSFGDFQAPQNRPSTIPPHASSRATPASYQPGTPNNVPPTRTSGPRNERTGSGLY